MTSRPTILVPLAVLEGESIPEGVPELLSGAQVLLLGYHELPEQTAAEQASEQFEPKASDRLEQLAAMLRAAGSRVDTRLVFTHERQQTINRVLVEEDCEAVPIPAAAPPIARALVAVRGPASLDRTVAVLAALFADAGTGITLYHVLESAEAAEAVTATFEAYTEALIEAGIDPEAIETRTEEGERRLAAIERVGADYDAIVMGESDPSVATYVFGLPEDQLAEQFLGPVLVIQRPPPA